jgi:PAS domain S-box-containing protein
METLYRKNRTRLRVVLVVFNVIIAVVSYVSLETNYHAQKHQTQVSIENISHLLEHEIARTLSAADTFLNSISDDSAYLPLTSHAWQAATAAQFQRLTQLRTLHIADAHGKTIFATKSPDDALTKLLQQATAYLQAKPNAGMFVSPPQLDPATGTWFVLLSRRMIHKGGTFAGVSSATLQLADFYNMFSNMNLGSMGSIALRDQDLRLLVRYPRLENDHFIGTNKTSEDFKAALALHPGLGVYTAESSSIDGVKRLHSYRYNPEFGFYINVGIAKDEYLDEWQRHLIQTVVIVISFLLTSLIIARKLNASWKKQQREMEMRLESEEKFHTAFDHDPLPRAIICLESGNLTDVNNSFVVTSGFARTTLLSTALPELVLFSDQDLELLKSNQTSHEFPDGLAMHLHRSNGARLDVITFAESILVNKQQHLMLTLQDITEKKTADETLRKLSQVAEQSPTAIVITDITGTIEYVNPRFVQLTGYSAAEVAGRNPSVLQSSETPHAVYTDLWQTILAGDVWEGDFCNKSKSGELFWEHSTISPLRDKEGQITHFIATKENITEKKNMLEQLIHSQKMESVGQLAGGIAHDFNNILSIINGYTCLMNLETTAEHPQKEYISFIQDASARAAELTQALLAFSRKQVMDTKIQNINIVLTDTIKLIERTTCDDIVFRMFFEVDPLITDVDSTQLGHVLINISNNAIDAMPHGGELTILSTRRSIDENFIKKKGFGVTGDYAIIEISDTGTGMDAETLKQVFDPFFTTKIIGKGTGLGMAMAFGIIKQHKGFIDVHSSVGSGTVFTLFLPLLVSLEKSLDTCDSVTTEPLLHGTETILLAEDDPSVRDIMHKILSNHGYTVIVAEDGVDAEEKFNTYADSVDLLFFDLIMPHKNGLDAWTTIKRCRPDIKVLFNSGYSSSILQSKDADYADAAFLTKPVLPKTLLAKIREILDTDAVNAS